jgi:hypothetical protein
MSRRHEGSELYRQARTIMGSDGRACHAYGGGPVLNYSWDETAVMQVLGETEYARFFAHIIETNLYGLGAIGLCVDAAPEGHDADGSWWEAPHSVYPACPYHNWRDDAIEEVGTVDITSAGVLLLAARYPQALRRG